MLTLIGDHFLYLVGASVMLFAVTLIYVSAEDAVRRNPRS